MKPIFEFPRCKVVRTLNVRKGKVKRTLLSILTASLVKAVATQQCLSEVCMEAKINV